MVSLIQLSEHLQFLEFVESILFLFQRAQHECVRVLLQHPSHSISKSGIRPPYLPPSLKSMVNLYRNNTQVKIRICYNTNHLIKIKNNLDKIE